MVDPAPEREVPALAAIDCRGGPDPRTRPDPGLAAPRRSTMLSRFRNRKPFTSQSREHTPKVHLYRRVEAQ